MATQKFTFTDLAGNPEGWNYRENFVQSDEGQGTAGTFIAAESTLICAGPATLSNQLDVVKIGLCPSIQISQNIPQQRIFELGSVRSHILNGIPIGTANLNNAKDGGDRTSGIIKIDEAKAKDIVGVNAKEITFSLKCLSGQNCHSGTPEIVIKKNGETIYHSCSPAMSRGD